MTAQSHRATMRARDTHRTGMVMSAIRSSDRSALPDRCHPPGRHRPASAPSAWAVSPCPTRVGEPRAQTPTDAHRATAAASMAARPTVR